MKVGTSCELKKIDNYLINDIGIPGCVLMENAANKVLKHIDLTKKRYIIICGKGNNGGDGFVISRHLISLGKDVSTFIIGDIKNMSKDCRLNFNILSNLTSKIINIEETMHLNILKEEILNSCVVIDCIFGTGVKRQIIGMHKQVIDIINNYSKYVISVDVPSGINPDTGEIKGVCVKAHKTVSFELFKKGFLKYGIDKFLGEIVIEKIGIPDEIVTRFHEKIFLLEKSMIKNKIVHRNKYSHKGNFGRILIIAGSEGFTGASYICTQAAIKSGAGLVTLGCFENIQSILSCKLNEAMTIKLEDNYKLEQAIKKSDCIAIGPGLGNNNTTQMLIKSVLKKANCPVVIDADGINALSKNMELLKSTKNEIILTPHPGEFKKISGQYEDTNRIKLAMEFAKENNVLLLLKGYKTVITDGSETYINNTGNSAMASGGMGDCLTGIIASFIGQGYKPMDATYISAYIHGYCGNLLSKDKFCVNATDILNYLPKAIKDLQNIQ